MDKLQIPPEQSSYSVSYNSGVINQQLKGGASRQRRDVLNNSSFVNVSWFVDFLGLQYLQAFYRTQIAKAGTPFEADLIVDTGGLETYQCLIVPNSWRVGNMQGLSLTVSATFEVLANPADVIFDQSLIDSYSSSFDLLEKLANVDLPDALENANL